MKIKKFVLEDLLLGARNTFPNEFFALLGEKNGVIEEFVLVPSVYGKTHAIWRRDLVPLDKSIVGSFHSHPSSNNNPSSADLRSFSSMGKIHLIAGHPFEPENVKAFDAKGKR